MSGSYDEQQVQRYVAGELSAEDAATFAARMLQDSELRERVEVAEAMRGGFAAAASAPTFSAPAGFTANVLAEVRRQPSREQMVQMDISEGAIKLCRRLLLAAAVLLGLGLVVYSGLFTDERAATLEAAPDEIQSEMDRLDELIRQGEPRRGK